MAEFITRVELNGANSNDYQLLHTRMAVAGFARTIRGSAGESHLPTAEYYMSGPFTTGVVRDKARAIAASIAVSNEVLTVEIANWSGYLEPVKKAG